MNQRLPYSFMISNVDVWNSNGIQKNKDVFFENSVLTKIVPTGSLKAVETSLDGSGLSLLPTGVDLQVHLRVPGQSQKETPLTGLKAALRGGVVAVLTMPNTQPVIDSPEVVAMAAKECALAEEQTGVCVLFSAAMTMGQQGQKAVDAMTLKEAGVVALTDDGRGVASDEVMEAVFKQADMSGLPLLQHAEVPGHGGVLAPGSTQKDLKIPAYSEEAEWRMVERDIHLARKYPKVRYHVLHVSSAKTVELIRKARAEGLLVSGEASPHHLWFSSEDIPRGNTSFKMNPPLRSNQDRQVLREALQDGTLSFVATDHAPHEITAKGENFLASAFGTTGLETMLRVLISLYQQKLLTAQRLVEVFAIAPARFIGLEAAARGVQEGLNLMEPGCGLLLVDTEASPQNIEVTDLESLSKNNCFVGTPLGGQIHTVINRIGASPLLHRKGSGRFL